MTIRMILLAAAVAAIAFTGCNNSDKPSVKESSMETETDRAAWFDDAQFGMFIHWGLYADPAEGEWVMQNKRTPAAEYEKLAAQFNPTEFNATEWVELAKAAGMEYLVITAKHFDGFCMWDTELTDYNIVDATPFGRDPLKELADACEEASIRFCVYYGVPDWHHPEFPEELTIGDFHGAPNPNADLNKYGEYLKGQVRELLTNYGPISIVWFDGYTYMGPKDVTLPNRDAVAAMIRQLQPNCLINSRLGVGADYVAYEEKIPEVLPDGRFEVALTLNDSWGYTASDTNWKDADEVIRLRDTINALGGNLLLNVGPTAEGRIPPEAERILREVGRRLAAHSNE